MLKGDGAVGMGASSVHSTGDVDARICTMITRSDYPCSTCHASFLPCLEEVRQAPALTLVEEEEEEEGDRRAGRVAVEPSWFEIA